MAYAGFAEGLSQSLKLSIVMSELDIREFCLLICICLACPRFTYLANYPKFKSWFVIVFFFITVSPLKDISEKLSIYFAVFNFLA